MMKFVDVNNKTYACKIHQREPKLPYLLMLHGFMGDHRVFDHLVDSLNEFCNPVIIDLLGHGKSSKPEDSDRYKAANQVKDILRVIKKLTITPLFLFGYSMGGRLALKMALSAPEMFKGLILESTTCGITDETDRKERREADEQRAGEIEKDYEKFLSKWKDMELFQSPLPINRKLVDNYRNIQLSQNSKAIAASLRGFGTGSMAPFCDQLNNFEQSVLLMAGTEDKKYQRISSFMTEQFPNAQFSSIKAGHRTHLDNPKEFVQELKRMIIQ